MGNDGWHPAETSGANTDADRADWTDAEKLENRLLIQTLQRKLVDAGALHLTDEQTARNQGRMVVALRSCLAEAREVCRDSPTEYASAVVAAADAILADTAEAAKGWIGPELAGEIEEHLKMRAGFPAGGPDATAWTERLLAKLRALGQR